MAMSKNVDKILSPDRDGIIVKEGAESDDFWNLLGGKSNYNRETFKDDTPNLSARLFHCSMIPPSTKLNVDEVYNFTQEVQLYTNSEFMSDNFYLIFGH